MDGWIKFWRQFVYWEWYTDNNVKSVFIHLLLCANHTDGNWRGIVVRKGQFVTSVEHLSNELHLSPQQVRTALNKLKSTNEITINTTNKYSTITICKYESYQSETITNQQAEKQTKNNQITNEQQTNNKQITTNKNNKNIKNENNEENNVAAKSAKQKFNPESILKDEPQESRELLERWLKYKQAHFGKTYKTEDSFRTFIKKLNNYSGGDFEIAKAIIENSIANCYQGIFEPKKQYQNGNKRIDGDIPTERIVAAGRAMAAAGL